MSLNKPLLAFVMIGSVSLAAPAFATTPSDCVSDSDCAHGYICQPSATIAPSTPKRCAPDADCPTTDGGGTSGGSGGSHVSVSLSTCEPGPCITDSDCGADMVCHAETASSCSGGTAPACPANTKCDLPADTSPPTCTTTTTSRCTFRWQLPCSADADCGSGFTCQPSVYGSCSGGSGVSGGTGGSAGTGNVAGDAAKPSGGTKTTTSPPDNCTTTTSFPGWCQVTAATCAADTDCPSNWLCQEGSFGGGTPVSTMANGTTGAGGVGGAGGTAEPEGGAASAPAATDVVAVPTTKMCVSPYNPPVRGKGDGGGGQNGGSETGTGVSPDSPPDTGGTLGGTPAPTVGSGSGTGGTTAVDQDSKAPGASNDSAGCSVSPMARHSGTGATALLTLFGLGLVAVRRRRG